jgi:hypothetical protein
VDDCFRKRCNEPGRSYPHCIVQHIVIVTRRLKFTDTTDREILLYTNQIRRLHGKFVDTGAINLENVILQMRDEVRDIRRTISAERSVSSDLVDESSM